jgi:hypothetical protein
MGATDANQFQPIDANNANFNEPSSPKLGIRQFFSYNNHSSI